MKEMFYRLFKSRKWDITWLVVGYALVIFGAIYSWEGVFSTVWLTSTIGGFLGLTIVLLFANQKGKLGSGLGVVGAGFDTFNYYKYGMLGNVFVGVYCGILYLQGFFRLGKEIKVTKFTKLNLLISIGLAIFGAILLYKFADTIMPEGAPMWVLVLNILVFVVQVVSQYLMVEGKAVSWIGWIIANFINIALNGWIVYTGTTPQAIIYLAMTIMYQLNSFKAAFLWFAYKEE